MSGLLERGVQVSRRFLNPGMTTGTPRDALASPSVHGSRPSNAWRAVIDELLDWQARGSGFLDEDDVPTAQAMETAIDFAVDCNEAQQPPPQSITPSGSGCVTFQWQDGPKVVTVEVLGTGSAEVTEFDGARVKYQVRIERDPLTRKMQYRH